MGTVPGTGATVDTEDGFIALLIPEDGSGQTGAETVTTAQTALGHMDHSATLTGFKGLCGANSGTGRILTGPADGNRKPSAQTSPGMGENGRPGKAPQGKPPLTGKHAKLATDTSFCIYHRQMGHLPSLSD